MALSNISVSATDHFAKGGVSKIEVASYEVGGQAISYTAATNVAAGAIGTNIVTLEFEKESAKMTSSVSNELVGLSIHTITIEGFIPEVSSARLLALQALVDSPLIAKVYTYDKPSNPYLVGWDESSSYSSSDSAFPMILSGIEVATGAGLAESNGCTVTFTCKQSRIPATY
tara:strand:+ start:54 stop:569 length:516 start_codon:yes stop_codon:yes gene_type:complete